MLATHLFIALTITGVILLAANHRDTKNARNKALRSAQKIYQ